MFVQLQAIERIQKPKERKIKLEIVIREKRHN